MSPLRRKALGATTATAIVMTLLGVAPAQAGEPDARPAHIAVVAKATGPNHFNSSINVDLPAGGTATVTSPTVDKTMTKAKVEVQDTSDVGDGFDELAFNLAMLPTPGQRITACLMAAFQSVDMDVTTKDALAQAEAEGGQFVILVIFFCLIVAQIVADLHASAQGSRVGPAPGCAIAPLGIKTKTTKTGGTYTMSATDKITKKKKNSKLKVKCVKRGNKNVYSVKPRKKGKTLRSVVGNNLVIGIASPSSAAQGVPLKVSFKAP